MGSYQPNFHVVLHQPEIAPNTGAIGRTCVAVQAKLWLVRPLGFRIDQKALRRAGLDYWQFLEWEIVDHWQSLSEALPNKSRYWYFSKTASRSFDTVEFAPSDVLVFGSETQGLPPSLLQQERAAEEQRVLRIPTSPWVRSLNLSCAVAVAAYQLVRNCQLWPT